MSAMIYIADKLPFDKMLFARFDPGLPEVLIIKDKEYFECSKPGKDCLPIDLIKRLLELGYISEVKKDKQDIKPFEDKKEDKKPAEDKSEDKESGVIDYKENNLIKGIESFFNANNKLKNMDLKEKFKEWAKKYYDEDLPTRLTFEKMVVELKKRVRDKSKK